MEACPEVAGYEILEPIGQGGMGEIYAARQLALGRKVAIKFLKLDDPDHETDLARFRREVELMAKVSHPSILPIHDFGEAEGRPYLVMMYVEGGDLRRRMTPGKPLPTAEVRSILRPVGAALAYLHRHDIIHRDLKPENILLHDGVNPLVTDFGIAALQTGGPSLTRTGHSLGTLGYVAPEQQYRLKVDARADQYSLAAVSYELITGQLPLGIFKPPSSLNPKAPKDVDAVVLRALQENPKDRYANISEFSDALDQALEDRTRRRLGLRFPRRKSVAVGGFLATGFAAAASVAALSLFSNDQPPPRADDARPAPAEPPRPEAAPARPPAPEKPATPPNPDPATVDPLLEKLKALMAVTVWKERNSPKGTTDDAASKADWFEAERRVLADLNRLAFKNWRNRGSPIEEGNRGKDEDWRMAKLQLYKQLTGEDYRETPSDRGAGPAQANK